MKVKFCIFSFLIVFSSFSFAGNYYSELLRSKQVQINTKLKEYYGSALETKDKEIGAVNSEFVLYTDENDSDKIQYKCFENKIKKELVCDIYTALQREITPEILNQLIVKKNNDFIGKPIETSKYKVRPLKFELKPIVNYEPDQETPKIRKFMLIFVTVAANRIYFDSISENIKSVEGIEDFGNFPGQ